jgi:hypothetical protein
VPQPTPVPDPCPRRDLRIVNYGLLGPLAESISYHDSDKRPVDEPVSHPDGGFLVVRRPIPVDEVSGGFSPGSVPVRQTFSSVTYTDGSQCRLKPVFADGVNRCPARGYAKPTAPVPTESQVRTKVHIAARRGQLQGQALYRVTVRFRARYPAKDGAYYVLGMGPVGSACNAGGVESPVPHDVARGQRVANVFWFDLKCTAVSGSVDYQPAPDQPPDEPYFGNPQDRINVGHPQIKLP